MGLIGMQVEMRTPHPQKLVDALYEEIFDHHPEDVEIDVILAVESPLMSKSGDRYEAETVTITDYLVVRIGDEILLDHGDWNGSPGDKAELIAYAKEIDTVARAMVGPDPVMHGYWFMHKHPEDVGGQASDKDVILADFLTTVDFVRGMKPYEYEGEEVFPRTFQMMAVLNRNESEPIPPGNGPVPADDREIDLGVVAKFRSNAVRQHELPPDHRYFQLLDNVEAAFIRRFDAIDRGDEGAQRAAEDELRALHPELVSITLELTMARLQKSLPPEVREIMGALEEVFGKKGITMERVGSLDELLGRDDADQFPPLDGNLGPDVAQPDHTPQPPAEETGRPDVPDVFDVEWLS